MISQQYKKNQGEALFETQNGHEQALEVYTQMPKSQDLKRE